METKHTPGPWGVVYADEFHGVYIESGLGGTVADLYFIPDPNVRLLHNFMNAEANARLIAAAPDMHDALSEACAALDAGSPIYPGMSIHDTTTDAIAKARGED